MNFQNTWVFHEIDDSDNIGNKGLHRKEQNKFSEEKLPPIRIEPGTLGLHLWHILYYTLMLSSMS